MVIYNAIMEQIRFDEQVVLITGAGRGLGAAYARLIAARGATVIVHDAGVDRAGNGGDASVAQAVVDQIVTEGGKAVAAVQNLAQRDSCVALVEGVVRDFGRIDTLIHNAGIVFYKRIAETTLAEWEQLRAIHIDAPFWLCHTAFPHMQQQQYGRIVLTVSGYGLIAFDDADVAAYGVGKGAQFGLMNMLASEGLQHNIHVNAISPVANTRMYRAKVAPDRFTAESVAPAVAFLASNACAATGTVVQAANGQFSTGKLATTPYVDLSHNLTPEMIQQRLF